MAAYTREELQAELASKIPENGHTIPRQRDADAVVREDIRARKDAHADLHIIIEVLEDAWYDPAKLRGDDMASLVHDIDAVFRAYLKE